MEEKLPVREDRPPTLACMTTDAHHGHPSTTLGDSGGPTGTTGPVGPVGRDPLPLAGRTVLVAGVSRRIGIGHAIA